MSDVLLMILRILTACSSMVMILSPSPTIVKIYKTKSVGHLSIFALAALLGNCHMWMLHGYLRNNIFPVFITFAAGDVISLFFIAVYVRYTTERAYVLRVLGVAILILALVTVYAILGITGVTHQTREQLKPIIGYIAIVAAILLYGAPFEKALLVLRHKTSKFIPISMVIVGTTNNALWVIYTPLDHNWFMFVPNAICVVLGLTQLCLYHFYHPDRVRARQDSHLSIELDDDGAIDVVIEMPTTDLTTGKQFPASPNFQLMHSPLASLPVIEIEDRVERERAAQLAPAA
ncbi:Mtn3-like protein [Globisporangium polare]